MLALIWRQKIGKTKAKTKRGISKAKGYFPKTNASNSKFGFQHSRVALAGRAPIGIRLIKNLTKKRKEFSFLASGQSMTPLILSGSRLNVEFLPKGKIKVGDIVFFRQNSKFSTHQLVYKSKKLWLTKGYASHLPDQPIKPAQVLGKVTKIEKDGKVFSPQALVEIQNLLYLWEFRKLNRLFLENGLKVINLKGIALSQVLGGKSLPGRFLSDLDILIQRKDFPQIARTLRNLGYKIKKQKGVPNFHYQEPYPIHQEITFKKRKAPTLAVDIHQELVGSTQGKLNPLPLEKNQKISQDFIKRAKLVKGEFLTLEENDLLFYLCLHNFFHHNCRGIEQLVNIAQVVEKLPINWKIFSQKVRKYSLENYLYYPLFLAKNLLGAKVPKKILDESKPKSFFSNLVPFFINQKNVFKPRSIHQLDKTNKENIVLRFLIIDKPLLWKIWYLLRPRVLFGFQPYLSVMPLKKDPS